MNYKCKCFIVVCFFLKQKTAYERRISDGSSDVCSSDLGANLTVKHDQQGIDVSLQVAAIVLDEATQRHATGKAIPLLGFQGLELTVGKFQASRNFARRQEERRVGKGCVRTCQLRRSTDT